MLTLINEHMEVLDAFNHRGCINKVLYSNIHDSFKDNLVLMYPDYHTIRRQQVCADILTNADFLGPRGGITTQNHGFPRYLAAITAAIIENYINSFELGSVLRDHNGENIVSDMNNNVQEKLARMCLSKKF